MLIGYLCAKAHTVPVPSGIAGENFPRPSRFCSSFWSCCRAIANPFRYTEWQIHLLALRAFWANRWERPNWPVVAFP